MVTKKILPAVLLLILISLSLGLFFFDSSLLSFKKNTLTGVEVFSNQKNLQPLWNLSLLALLVLTVLVLFLGVLLKSRKRHRFWDGLILEVSCFLPLCLLVFSRFFEGKAVKLVSPLPLYPIYLILILGSVFHLHSVLFFDLNIFRRLFFHLQTRRALYTKLFVPSTVFVLLAILVLLLTDMGYYIRFTGSKLFGGDEPKYVRMAYSLAADRDLDLANNFYQDEDPDTTLETGMRVAGSASIYGKDGIKVYPLHMPGLAFLMLPGFVVDFMAFPPTKEKSDLYDYYNFGFLPQKLPFTRLWLLFISILTFLLVARLVYRIFQSPVILALLLFLLIASSPIPNFMFQLYPEVAAGFFTLIALNAILFPFKKRWVNHVLIMLGIGFLPWLHQRLFVLALSLYIVYIVKELVFQKNIKKVLTTSFLLFLASLPYFFYFFMITGNPLPTSIHKVYGSTFTRVGIFPLGFFGHLFDHSVGIVWLFPWTILAILGIYWGLKEDRRQALLLLLVFIPYYLMTCFHIAWHGMNRFPGRYLVSIFPILLFFLGYTVKVFIKRKSYFLLFLYAFLLLPVLLNRKIWFLSPDFGGPVTQAYHLPFIIQGTLILIFVFSAVVMGDKFTRGKPGRIHWEKGVSLFKEKVQAIFISKAFKNIHKPVFVLFLLAVSGYTAFFLISWNKKALALSPFETFTKLKQTKSVALFEKGEKDPVFQKGDQDFVEFFTTEFRFRTDSKGEWQKKIGGGLFWKKIASGNYKVRVVTDVAIPDGSLALLEFLGENKGLGMSRESDQNTELANFFLFTDRFVDAKIRLLFDAPEAADITGRIEFYPIPSVTFGEELILRPINFRNPYFFQEQEKNQYKLLLNVTTRNEDQKYQFYLYSTKGLFGFSPEKNKAFASSFQQFEHNYHPYELEMDFRVPLDFAQNKPRLVVVLYDKKGREMACTSKAFMIKGKYWILPEE